MNDQVNLSSILDEPTTLAERPRPLPRGSYICSVLPDVQFGVSPNKGTEYVSYKLQILDLVRDKEGKSDVDESELEEAGGIGNLQPVNVSFYLTDRSKFIHKGWLDNLGVPETNEKERDPKKRDLSHRQRALMAPGCQVIANFKHEPSQDGQVMYARLNYSAPVE